MSSPRKPKAKQVAPQSPTPKQSVLPPDVARHQKTAFNWLLLWLIAVYVVLTSLLIFAVPIGQTPDEGAHLDYIEYIATKARMPIFNAASAPGYGYEFHQPPLYYLVCAPVWKVAVAAGGKEAGAYACRLISLTCGVFTLVLLWHAIGHFFQASAERRTLQVLAVGLGALWPLHQGVGASAGNDALAGLMSAALFFLVVARSAKEEVRTTLSRRAALLGICLGLAILAKTTNFILCVVAFGAVISWWIHVDREKRGPIILPLATLVLTAAIVCGWWLLRNQLLYGDPLAAQVFQRAFSQSSHGPSWFFERGTSLMVYLELVAGFLFCSAFGVMGGSNTAQRHLASAMVVGVEPGKEFIWVAIAFLGLCALACVVSLSGWRSRKLMASLSVSVSAQQGVLLWLLGLALVTLAWGLFNLSYFQVQARYFHPALLPMCLFFAIGWRQALVSERVMRATSFGFGGVLLLITLWNVFVWKTLV